MFSASINSINDLDNIAKQLLEEFKHYKIFAFYGEMGVGKTTFIKAICKQLGVKNLVTSPTFSIINEYSIPNSENIFHFDFYRIENEEEAFDIGYEDYFYSNNFCFVEWPEKIENLLPSDTISIKIIENDDKSRSIISL
ncbi:MAG: tRNA (adenosine(37)-N6)-threonylcarbamoyltransferase complex ATPase subunit type 1 TsaE [Bacteroidetes bacterium]|jgi:tRNA threonylcarbamoyladenosine biosynthesis protein TsaE|nr:tRNA (adenosine(37)-N6)-threonylcarbamoyltransferase complex ATPase subunit type 1 TsaE [Bacteroidota bacterium]MBT6687867.1 tRNA (adenosine(37)-N6)-threonylcarbamoyltransferase complex ATPase subunit type 1 TsaE [Bacteroidota bacterium]MBT7142485.1 tRNA (adenosine(37)-N6)-threonylcarbamoyltransferase complex ATPase subunit type 1 TsaE [Bacteroidota bacterium]MBT7490008.1 tRNA (adenosine(37)-N6)-threonylcarbamoyltransferase complex ATPase subunit type 1 TsaE [Bacteroidota bacterium]